MSGGTPKHSQRRWSSSAATASSSWPSAPGCRGTGPTPPAPRASRRSCERSGSIAHALHPRRGQKLSPLSTICRCIARSVIHAMFVDRRSGTVPGNKFGKNVGVGRSRYSVDVAPNWPTLGQCREELVQKPFDITPHLGRARTRDGQVGVGRIWTGADQVWPDLGSESARRRSNLGRCPNQADVGQVWAGLGQIWSAVGRHEAKVVTEVDLRIARFGPRSMLSAFDLSWTEFDPCGAISAPHRRAHGRRSFRHLASIGPRGLRKRERERER